MKDQAKRNEQELGAAQKEMAVMMTKWRAEHSVYLTAEEGYEPEVAQSLQLLSQLWTNVRVVRVFPLSDGSACREKLIQRESLSRLLHDSLESETGPALEALEQAIFVNDLDVLRFFLLLD